MGVIPADDVTSSCKFFTTTVSCESDTKLSTSAGHVYASPTLIGVTHSFVTPTPNAAADAPPAVISTATAVTAAAANPSRITRIPRIELLLSAEHHPISADR